MMELNKAMLKHLAEQLQVDDSSPSYIVRVWRVGENLYEQDIKFYAPNKLGVGWI